MLTGLRVLTKFVRFLSICENNPKSERQNQQKKNGKESYVNEANVSDIMPS